MKLNIDLYVKQEKRGWNRKIMRQVRPIETVDKLEWSEIRTRKLILMMMMMGRINYLE